MHRKWIICNSTSETKVAEIEKLKFEMFEKWNFMLGSKPKSTTRTLDILYIFYPLEHFK
jgi:hypothetical protein